MRMWSPESYGSDRCNLKTEEERSPVVPKGAEPDRDARSVQWAPGLPKTRSGKIMRRILRNIAANEYDQLGDTLTLADPTVVDDLVDNRMNRWGLRSARATQELKELLETLLLVSMLDFDLVPKGVANYQALRRRGITVGTVDMVVGTYCIETGAGLLTADHAFQAMRDHLGLQLVA